MPKLDAASFAEAKCSGKTPVMSCPLCVEPPNLGLVESYSACYSWLFQSLDLKTVFANWAEQRMIEGSGVGKF